MNKLSYLAAASMAAVLAACGQDAPPPAPAAPPPPVASAPAPAAAPQNTVGEGVYRKTCALCHAAGVAGAPRLKDAADWGPRIAQGIDTLYLHSLEGYTGEKGMMPARGGAAALSDEEVKAAVDYMVASVQ
ncbi:c-type cytochrome [Pseudothauera lacus]|uniref:Cytochrome c5 family protein n=1 Tax=Pseudothauera lacus TaxID=2136175 RepID=A0A2T4IK36_9RHOO|nr:c-type cytochrome [Pseudothauera lacus]PTD98143.1 cytochrome c5 family protein [Pseudothauera lacus]